MPVQTLDAAALHSGQSITLEGDWEITGEVPKNVSITVTNGSLKVGKAGHSCTITASGDIELGQISFGATVDTGGHLKLGKAIGSLDFPSSFTAKSIEGNTVAEANKLVARAGGIRLNQAGHSCTIIASGDIELGQISFGATVDTGGHLKLGKAIGSLDFPSSFTAKSIEGNTVAEANKLVARAGGIRLNQAGHSCTITASGDIELGQISFGATVDTGGHLKLGKAIGSLNFPSSFNAMSVIADSVGEYSSITATQGDIYAKNVAQNVTLNARDTICLGTAGSNLKATAGKVIYYEKFSNNSEMNAPECSVRAWQEPPAIKPNPKIQDAEHQQKLSEAQRNAALDHGQGL